MNVNHLQEENIELHKDKVAARQTIDKHTAQLGVLEAYNEINNMMIYGLPEVQPSRHRWKTSSQHSKCQWS